MIDAAQEKKVNIPRILVAPLDWGLGHATRCIPVIYELLEQGAEVWLAGEGAQETLLKQEFPTLPFLALKGYRVRYSGSRTGLWRALFSQLPRILKTIKNENTWLKSAVREYQFDAIIADNRFGLHHSSIISVFITHQLKIKTPIGKWSEYLLQKMNYRYINRFTECWIPDDENKIAGELSHPATMPATPTYYTGILSRLKITSVEEKKGQLFISLSGPEPQRTLLENMIVNEISHYTGTATIVRGLPGVSTLIPSTNDIRFYNHLPAGEFNREMERAEYVISRSGYSTIMDIISMYKKSILIPTPGQTEQEYLATYLSEKKVAFYMRQEEFSLQKALQKASVFGYRNMDGAFKRSQLSMFIHSFLNRLSAAK